jgi:nitrite reductase (NADH) large subunit
MQSFTHLIIGGGIAGTTAAETIRKHDAHATIAIVSDEPHPLYSRVLLSKPAFLTGTQPFESVWMKKPEWYEAERITFLGSAVAKRLDAAAKTVTSASAAGAESSRARTGSRRMTPFDMFPRTY